MLIVHTGKWLLAELLRIAWNKDPKIVGETIAQLVQIEHSLIHELDGNPLVLSTSISIPEEILLLLNHAPGNRLTRSAIRASAVNRSSSAINTAITRLVQSKELREAGKAEVALTPLGQKRVMEKILPELGKAS